MSASRCGLARWTFVVVGAAVGCGGPAPSEAVPSPNAGKTAAKAESAKAPEPPALPKPLSADLEGFGTWLEWMRDNPTATEGALLEDPRSWFAEHFDPKTAARLAATYERDRESFVEVLLNLLRRGSEGALAGSDGPASRTPFVVTAADDAQASARQAKALAAATAPLQLFGFNTRRDPHNGDPNGARVESFVFRGGRFVFVGDLADVVEAPPSCASVRHHPSAAAPQADGDQLKLGLRAAGLAVGDQGETVAVSRLDGAWLWRRASDEIVRLPYREHWSFCVEVAADRDAAPRGFPPSAVMDGRQTPWHERARHALAMTQDVQTLYLGGHDGSVVSYSLGETEPRAKILYRHASHVTDLDISKDAALLVSASRVGGPILWDGKLALQTKDRQQARSLAITFSPNGRRFMVAQPLRFWDVGGELEPTRTETFIGNHPFTVDVAWTSDGQYVIGAGEAIEVWDVSAKASILHQRFESPPFMTSISPDGSILATSHDGFVQLWEPKTATKTRKLSGISGVTMAMGWSPNGRFLALADAAGMRVQVRKLDR